MLTGIPEATRVVASTAIAAAFTETADGATLKLFKNDFVPGPWAVVANFTEADFVGYAKIDALIDWLNYRSGPTGDQIVELNALGDFAAGAIMAEQDVFGWYLVNHAETALHAWGRFDDKFTFTRLGDTLTFPVAVVFDPTVGQTNRG